MKITITNVTALTGLIMLLFSSILQSQPLVNLILEGEVSSKQGIWSSDTKTIYTINWFKPSRIYDGTTPFTDSIPILTSGGKTGDGLLVVSHALFFHENHNYIISLEPCKDCVDGMLAYLPIRSVGDFDARIFLQERKHAASNARTGGIVKG